MKPTCVNKNNINVAFCTDKNFLAQTCVSITSLLISAANKCAYNIYCVTPKNFSSKDCNYIKDIVKFFSSNSKIKFLHENGTYDNAFVPVSMIPPSNAAYYRLMLPEILTDIDKIIYLDSDTIILRDLIKLNEISFENNLLIGCLDFANHKTVWEQKFTDSRLLLKRGEYINSGMMVMNLKKIRQNNLSKIWIDFATKYQLRYKDQDILNSTCLGKIKIIDSKYNINIIDGTIIKPTITSNMLKKALVLHYIYPKPWQFKSFLSSIWWDFAKKTRFYSKLNLTYAINLKGFKKLFKSTQQL